MRVGWMAAASLAAALGGCGVGLERAARERLGNTLFDPASAQFRNLFRHEGTVCGEVNAKNRMGGYVGFKPFFAPAQAPPEVDPDPASGATDAAEIWGKFVFDTEFRNKCSVSVDAVRAGQKPPP